MFVGDVAEAARLLRRCRDLPGTASAERHRIDGRLSALESLLFAKYQMYRNVYWHHAVRSATAMYKRLVEDAVRENVVDVQSLARHTDEGLIGLGEKRFSLIERKLWQT